MNVATYYRVSSKGQKDRGTIENQKFKIDPYCLRKGFKVVAEFSDPAVSGNTKLESRPEGKKLVAMLKAKKKVIDGVVVVHVDRLTRSDSAEERGRIWDLLAARETHFYQVDGFDYKHEAAFEQMIFLNEAFFANWVLQNLREKQQAGRDRAVVENRFAAGGQPYGVRWAYDKEHPNRGEWVPVPEQVETIQKAMDLVREGHSLYYIVDYLNANNYPTKYKTRKGKKARWSHGSLWHNLVKGDFLFTGLRDGDGLDTKIQLFTKEEVTEIRRIISMNRRGHGRSDVKAKETPHHLLKRLIKCECGWHLSSVTTDGRRYYRCKRCGYSLRADDIDTKIWTEFYATYSDVDRMKAAVKGGGYATIPEKLKAAKEQLVRADAKLEKIKQRRLIITSQLTDVDLGLDPKMFKTALADLKAQEDDSAAAKAEAEQTINDPEILDEAVELACSALIKQLTSLDNLSRLVEEHEGEGLPVERLKDLDTFHVAAKTRKSHISFQEVALAIREQKRSILKAELAKGQGIIANKQGAEILGGIGIPETLPNTASGQAIFG